MLASLGALLRELPGLLSARVELLGLELRCAGGALAQITMLVVAVAILGITAWLALWLAIGTYLVVQGNLHWGLAMLLTMLANLLAIWLALWRVRALTPLLRLPATQRHLMINAAESAAAEAGAPQVAAVAELPRK